MQIYNALECAKYETMTDGVVLLHGIMRSRLSMRSLEKFLKKQGFKTLNIGYRSTRQSIEDITDSLQPCIVAFAQEVSGNIHFVGYSMGGLIIRAYLKKYRPERLGRVVMLGTPNKGSKMADIAKNWWFFRFFYGPAGQQLVTDQSSFSHLFGPVDYELGIVAGNCNLDPLASLIIGTPNDGKVSIESTKLEGMADHTIIGATHTFIASKRAAQAHTVDFLQTGAFKKLG
jgi:pimeloyl-ACP methyl ester carboxylesterase